MGLSENSLTGRRIRRKKCDEERPSCRRCTDTGRKCNGYSVQLARTCQKDTSKSLLSNYYCIQEDCSWTFLQFFRLQTIPTFSSYYDSTLWEITLAQTSVSEAVLQSAAVAFAAAHYECETGHTRGFTLSNQRNLTIKLYTDAISKARHALVEASLPKDAVRIGFIVSFMLAGIETLRGSKAGVTLHLANGLKIAFSQGYDTIKTSWKINTPGLLLTDAVLALIARLNVAIEHDFDKGPDDRHGDNSIFYIHGKSTKTWHPLRNFFQGLSNVINDIMAWLQDPTGSPESAYLYLKPLDNHATTLQKLRLDPSIDRRSIRLLRLYREAAHLLLLCHLNDAKALGDTDSPRCSNTDYESRSIHLKAYFSKLSIIEEQLRLNHAFATHLSPASLKRFAVRHSLIYPWSSEYPCATKASTPLYNKIEQLVMLEEGAIMGTNLVPTHAMCIGVASALEHGCVSIRYCVLSEDGESFDWIEKKASLWKPVVFVVEAPVD
jgi:hypothetical protein